MQLLRPSRVEGDGVTEEALIRRAATGDVEAFADLYERYLDRMFRYFYYRLAHREDAEDLSEQVFLRAWQALPGYNCRGVPFAAWLFRIAHNLLVDYHRRNQDTTQLDDALDVADEGADPHEIASRRYEAQALAAAISQLSAVEQSVVVLRFVEGMDHRSVASIIEKSEVATRSIQSRALARLARLLDVGERSKK